MFGFFGSETAPVQRLRSSLIVTLVGKISQSLYGPTRCLKFRVYVPGRRVQPKISSDTNIPRGSVSSPLRGGNTPISVKALFTNDTEEKRLTSSSFSLPFSL